MDRRDGETALYFFQRDLGGRFQFFGGELCLAQDQRQRHGEAAGVRRADQLLRVRARHPLKPAGEAVGMRLQGAALGRDRAFAVLESAAPNGGPVSSDLHCRAP